jgi:hypothetical protein
VSSARGRHWRWALWTFIASKYVVLVVCVPQDQRLAVRAIDVYAFITAAVLIVLPVAWTLQQGLTVARRLHLGGVILILAGVCSAAVRQVPSHGLEWEAYPIIVGMDMVLIATALLTRPLRPR